MRFLDLPPVWALPLAPLLPGMGRVFVAAGLGLIVWAALWARRKRTPIEPARAPRALMVEGPYRINRNPIHTGTALVLLGWGLWLGALAALIPAAVFPVLVTRRFIRSEEAALRRAFGPEAEPYFARTRRW